MIRLRAEVGDWIVGTGSKRLKRRYGIGCFKLIYAMKVDEKLTFEQYSKDPRFEKKIPRYGRKEERGDNIYYKDKEGRWYIRPSYHYGRELKSKKVKLKSPKVWIRDLSGCCVLVSRHFFYFGREAVELPKEFRIIANAKDDDHGLSNYRSEKIPKEVAERFIEWLERKYETKNGCIGVPCEFKRKYSKEFFEKKPILVPL